MFTGQEIIFSVSSGLYEYSRSESDNEIDGIVISPCYNKHGSMFSLYVMSLDDDSLGKVHLVPLHNVTFKDPEIIKNKLSGLEDSALKMIIDQISKKNTLPLS